MSYLVVTPSIKKKFCMHHYKIIYPLGVNEAREVCTKCNYSRKPKPKNQSLIKYLCPASKPSDPDYFEEHQFLTNWYTIQHDGWKLPATEEEHYWCSIWQTKGCLNEKEHSRLGYKNKIFVRQYQLSCFRAVCRICYKKWIGRQANRSTRRIEKFEKQTGQRAKHIVLSVPKWQHNLSYKQLRDKANLIQKEIGCLGGARVFHPFRFSKLRREFYYSPHFHIVGIGHIRVAAIAAVARKHGWFIKDIGIRESVFQTFYYLLSHCGIKKGFHALTWFGAASYSKLILEKEPDSTVCPLCGRKLVSIYHDGVDPPVPPDEYFEDFVDSADWFEVMSIPESELTKQDRYELVLEKELYVANKGIELVLT